MESSRPVIALLASQPAVVVGVISRDEASALADRVLAARAHWTADFGGEQFALGRAFYTHLETGRSREYFAGAVASDALVESVLPGIPARTLALLERLLGASVRRRPGFCGPGVVVFPAGEKVAREGGVVHYDLEGLTDHQLREEHRAVSLVWTLRPGDRGGGLRLWNCLYDGRPDTEVDPDAHDHVTLRAEAGEAILFDSRRLHQIQPFGGDADRIAITMHAAELDPGVWEAWF